MKINLILIFITLILMGCRSSEEPTPETISGMVIPHIVEVQKRFLADQDISEGALNDLIEKLEAHNSSSRKVLSDILEQEFSQAELRDLQEIYESQVMVKLQMILSSYDFLLEVQELAQMTKDEIN